MQTIRIYAWGIGVNFDMENFALHVMKSETEETAGGRELLNHECIRTLGEK